MQLQYRGTAYSIENSLDATQGSAQSLKIQGQKMQYRGARLNPCMNSDRPAKISFSLETLYYRGTTHSTWVALPETVKPIVPSPSQSRARATSESRSTV